MICVVESVMCQLFHKSWSLYYALRVVPVLRHQSGCCVAEDPFRATPAKGFGRGLVNP